MNIFVLDSNPEVAARMLKWGHVSKMILESAQMLSNVLPPEIAPYKCTHYNHPCSKWVRESYGNFQWLVKHANVLCSIYTNRQHRTHKSQNVIAYINKVVSSNPGMYFKKYEQTPFATAMPQEYIAEGDPVASYRKYYVVEKAHIRE